MADFITGDGRLFNVKDIADVYRDVVSLSTPESGKIQRLGESHYGLTCHFSAKDCDILESVKTSKAYSLATATRKNGTEKYIESVRCITDPHTVAEIAVTTSENGRFLARLKYSTNATQGYGSDKRQLLEIWDRSKLLKTIDISDVETHGQINTDSVFSSFCWTPFDKQDKLLYVCQRKQPKYQSFFKQATVKKGEADDGNAKGKLTNLGDDHVMQEDWGEGLKGIDHTIMAMLDASEGCKITTLDMEGYSLADSRWLDGLKTISIAYPEECPRLGLLHCNNRPNRLVIHDWAASKKEVVNLSSDSHCFLMPRVSHSGKKFIYHAAPAFGPHHHSVRLHLYDLDTNEDRELADDRTGEVDHFILKMNDNCFSTDDKHILFSKNDYLHRYMCLYSLESSTITKIKFPTTGLQLLDFRYDIILAVGSEVNATPTLFVSVLNPVDPGELVAWHQIEDCIHLDEIDYETYQIRAEDSNLISALLVTPNVNQLHTSFVNEPKQLETGSLASIEYDLPTVVMVHGGPHSAYIVQYAQQSVIYARLGLRILYINYRGSSGVSEDYLHSLCGHLGEVDLADCLLAIRHLVQSKVINPDKLVIQGGSHGGFLSCHLSCQDEFKFTSAVIINPVTDLPSMAFTSDVPDWITSEALNHKTFDRTWFSNPQDLTKMFECSPVSKYRRANVPTLMLLGNQDHRVKMIQGEKWFKLLKSMGVKAQCKVYPDKHDLGKVETESDRVISAIIWILSNLRTR